MARYLIDENLPYYFKLWNTDQFEHVFDIRNIKTDNEIWEYAKKNQLIIVTKDSDFSNRIMYNTPPPKVIHIRSGNLRIKQLHSLLMNSWKDIEVEVENHKLVNVFLEPIESIS